MSNRFPGGVGAVYIGAILVPETRQDAEGRASAIAVHQ